MKYLKLFENFNHNQKIEFINNLIIEYLFFSALEEKGSIKKINDNSFCIFYNFHEEEKYVFRIYRLDERRAWPTSNTRELLRLLLRLLGHSFDFWHADKLTYNMHGNNPIWKAISKYISSYSEK